MKAFLRSLLFPWPIDALLWWRREREHERRERAAWGEWWRRP